MTKEIWTPQEVENILNSAEKTREEKVEVINEYFDAYLKELDKELNNYLIREYGIAALEIGSAVIPFGGVGKVGAKLGEKLVTSFIGKNSIKWLSKNLLKSKTSQKILEKTKRFITGELLRSKIGRKFTQDITAGVIDGGFAGMFIGLLEGYIDDENHLWSTIGGAITGMVGGGLLGSAGAYVERFIAAKKLKNYNFKTNAEIYDIAQELQKQYRKDVKEFYQKYIQDIVLIKDGKRIPFTGKGLEEQLKHNPKQGQNFPDLIKDIKNASAAKYSPNIKPEQKPDISHYEFYEGKYGNHYVEILKNKDKRFYITKDDIQRCTTRNNSPDTSKDVSISDASHKVQNKSDTNPIIPNVAPVVNPTIGDNLNNNEVLKGHVEENVYKDNNNSNNDNQKEPEINPELLKPLSIPENQNTDDGKPTGGPAGIEETKIPDDIIKQEAQKSSDPLFMESYLSEVGEYGTLREKFKNGGSFHYNRNEKLEENLPPAESELSRLKRNVEKINEMLAEMKEQLDYHEKVVNVYNCPELAEFYLHRPVRNIIADFLEDYCIMEGIDYED